MPRKCNRHYLRFLGDKESARAQASAEHRERELPACLKGLAALLDAADAGLAQLQVGPSPRNRVLGCLAPREMTGVSSRLTVAAGRLAHLRTQPANHDAVSRDANAVPGFDPAL
jgi:hypothetical protein